MSLRRLPRALRARWRVFVVALSAVVLAATLASLKMPKSYRATVSVLVDVKDEQSLSDALRPLLLPQERMGYLMTQVDILTSPRVARQVAQDLDLAHAPAALAALGVKRGRDGRIEERLVEVLQHNFKAVGSQSSVIQGSFTCADPNWAATIANAFAKAYVDTMLALRVAPTRNAAAWFDEQLKSLRANVEDARSKLGQAKLVAQEQLTEHPERLEKLPEVMGSLFIQQLKAEVLHGEAKLQELATQYGVNHPVYRRQASENQSLRARLQTEMRKLASGAAGAELTAGAEIAAKPEDVIGTSRTSPQRGPERQGRSDSRLAPLVDPVLVRNVETAEHAYDTAMQRYVVSQVDSRASQTSVTVLNPAVAPLTPYRPNIRLNLALALLSGVVLGGVLVVFLETREPVVRSAEDLSSMGQVPLLAVLGGDSGRRALLAAPPAPVLLALPKPD